MTGQMQCDEYRIWFRFNPDTVRVLLNRVFSRILLLFLVQINSYPGIDRSIPLSVINCIGCGSIFDNEAYIVYEWEYHLI